MSKRAGLRSPASAASRIRVASNVLLDCACCSGDNELHAKSSATCMFFTVSVLKCLPSAAMNVPRNHEVSNLAKRAAPRLSDARPNGAGFLHHQKADKTAYRTDVCFTPQKRIFVGAGGMSACGKALTGLGRTQI